MTCTAARYMPPVPPAGSSNFMPGSSGMQVICQDGHLSVCKSLTSSPFASKVTIYSWSTSGG